MQVNFVNFVPVVIDIKPGKDPNLVNLCHPADLPVAILSSETFDAVTEVDLDTVLFAGAPVKRDKKGRPVTQKKDVNKDRIKDLIVKFEIPEMMGLMPGDTLATLLGQTLDSRDIEGIGAVEVEERMCVRTLE